MARSASAEVERVRNRLAEMVGIDFIEQPEVQISARMSDCLSSPGAETAFSRIAAWVNVRDRSVEEVSSRLRKESYSLDDVEAAVSRARSCGLLDDGRFVLSFVRGKSRLGWGRRKIALALAEHRLDVSSFPEVEAEYLSCEAQEELASQVAAKRPVSGKNPVEKLARHLVSRGFETSLSYEVARKAVKGRYEVV